MPAYEDNYNSQQIINPQLFPNPRKYISNEAVQHEFIQQEYISLSRGPSVTNLQATLAAEPRTASGTRAPSLNTLPSEILTQILQDVILAQCNGTPANYNSSTIFFARLLTTCFEFYDVGTPILYRHVAFSDPYTFDKFLRSIRKTGYGIFTRTLDFSGLTSVGLGRTAKMNNEIQMLTSTTILKALDLCPNLNEFLASENIEKDMDERVLTKLFTEMPFLSGLDFCGATDTLFVKALGAAAESMSTSLVTRLSLHGCSTVPSSILETLLGKLPNLKRLDLTHTQTNSEALLALPPTAALTHLSLSKCVRLSSSGTLKFLVLHNATRSLQWLNMLFEVTRPAPISSVDLDTILRYLPPLRYLNLHGLPIRGLEHLASMNLQSLSLGYANFSIDALQKFLPKLDALEYLDLSGNPNINLWTVQDVNLLNANPSIKIFEFTTDLLSKMQSVNFPGFSIVLGQGRRGWLVRNTLQPPNLSNVQPVPPPAEEPKRFTFSNFAETRIRNRSSSGSGSPPPLIQPQQFDMTGSPAWTKASRKINVCFVGIGGNTTSDACKERGIYLYYGYRK